MTPQSNYQYSPTQVNALRESLSSARLSRYKSLTDGTDKDALTLYCWNTALGQSFYWPLHAFEITLRNALAEAIKEQYGSDWYDKLASLSSYHGTKSNTEVEHIVKAKYKLNEASRPYTHDNIIAASTLGFWHGLFKQEYERKLYTPLFANLLEVNGREEAYRKIQQVKRLRNNIAHHEPIIISSQRKDARELYKDYKVILKIIRWLNPETAAWVESYASAEFFETWNSCPSFFKTLPLSTTSPGEIGISDNWQWYTPTGPIKK